MTKQVLQILKCEVYRQEITPGDSHKSTYRQGVDQVVNKFLFDMRGSLISVNTILPKKGSMSKKGKHLPWIACDHHLRALLFGFIDGNKMDVVIEVTDSQAFPWKIFSLLNSFFIFENVIQSQSF